MQAFEWLRGLRLVADRTLRRPGLGVIVGGSPMRLWRVSERADELLGEVVATGRAPRSDDAAIALLARMVQAGMLHPVFESPDVRCDSVAVVIPVFNHADQVARAISAGSVIGPVTVVDDVSTDASAAVAARAGAHVIRRRENGGPSAARNQGVAATQGEIIVFIDADCVPGPGTLDVMLSHFADPRLGAVAPRIRQSYTRASGLVQRFEMVRSPLDLGRESGPVRPDARIAYVPTATVAVRREAFESVGGFDESLRFGEDVDFMWRLAENDWSVRYEAAVTAGHRSGRGPLESAYRRWEYGTSAGPLAERHPDVLAAVRASPWTMAAWLAVLSGRFELAVILLLWSWLGMRRALKGVPKRGRISGHLVGRGFLGMTRPLAAAMTRNWAPMTVVMAATRRRLGRRLVALVAVGMAIEWWERRPEMDPLTFSAMAVIDDLLYCGGVWAGCARSRQLSPLLPRTGSPRIGRR